VGGAPIQGNLRWYFDPLPTNCVADWVCPGGTGAGCPKWARRPSTLLTQTVSSDPGLIGIPSKNALALLSNSRAFLKVSRLSASP